MRRGPKKAVLGQKWPNMAGLLMSQSGLRGSKMIQNDQYNIFFTIWDYFGPIWTLLDLFRQTWFFASKAVKCFLAKVIWSKKLGFVPIQKFMLPFFETLNRALWSWNWYKIVISGFRVCNFHNCIVLHLYLEIMCMHFILSSHHISYHICNATISVIKNLQYDFPKMRGGAKAVWNFSENSFDSLAGPFP